MKRLMPWALPIALLSSYQAHAADRCNWTVGSQPMTITRILSGVMHVPANAEPGSAIGTPNLSSYTQSMPRSELLCFNDGDVLWRFDMNARDVFPDPLPPVEGEASDGYILKTNIDGVGARIRLRAPFNGAAPTFFMPEGGPHNPFIPMRSTMQANNQLGGFKLSGITSEVTLVKTGDIAPGQHTVDTELFTGHFDATGLGLVLRYRLQAQVLQTQCALIGDPISDTPVELQTWEKSHFVGKGTTTATVPFSITLSNCKTDPGGLTMATIELDPTKGSTPVPGLDGVFTLTTDSTAEGVYHFAGYQLSGPQVGIKRASYESTRLEMVANLHGGTLVMTEGGNKVLSLPVNFSTPYLKETGSTGSSSTLDPVRASNGATVIIKAGNPFEPADSVRVYWANPGEHGAYDAPVEVATGDIACPIPRTNVAARMGSSLALYYTVTRRGTTHTSGLHTLTVRAPNNLPAPQCEAIQGGELSLTGMGAQATFTLNIWPLRDTSQFVRLHITGKRNDGGNGPVVVTDATPVTSATGIMTVGSVTPAALGVFTVSLQIDILCYFSVDNKLTWIPFPHVPVKLVD